MTIAEQLQTVKDNTIKVLNAGYKYGYDDGYPSGEASGYKTGYADGYAEGENSSFDRGYSYGYETGFMEGEASGIEIGKQAEYDAFWDAYQDNGERTDYTYGFSSWRTGCFYPKYDINIVGSAYNAFYGWKGGKIDLAARMEECGVRLDTSRATSFEYTFYCSNVNAITRIPKIDTSGADRLAYTFCSSPALITIDELVLREDGSQTFGGPFDWSQNLTNLKVSGTIGTSGFNLNTNAKLSKESIISVVNALSSTVTGQAQTFSLTAVNNAFEGGSTGSEWQALIATKPNWTISLV